LRVHIDLFEPLPANKKEKNVNIYCWFIHMEVAVIQKKTEKVTEALWNTTTLRKLMGIKKSRTTPYPKAFFWGFRSYS
jgi:hypothetical protein